MSKLTAEGYARLRQQFVADLAPEPLVPVANAIFITFFRTKNGFEPRQMPYMDFYRWLEVPALMKRSDIDRGKENQR